MRLKISLILAITCLSACGHGPKLNVCISDGLVQYDCSNAKGVQTVVPFSASAGMKVMSPDSDQDLFNYCAARNQSGTQAKNLTVCTSDPASGGLDCELETCKLNPQMNGMACFPGASQFVPFSQTENYVALSPSDSKTLLAYCNITL